MIIDVVDHIPDAMYAQAEQRCSAGLRDYFQQATTHFALCAGDDRRVHMVVGFIPYMMLGSGATLWAMKMRQTDVQEPRPLWDLLRHGRAQFDRVLHQSPWTEFQVECDPADKTPNRFARFFGFKFLAFHANRNIYVRYI